jgi:prophage DNA circulation protein
MPEPAGPDFPQGGNFIKSGQTRNVTTPGYAPGPHVSQIMELPNTRWRDALVPASFNGAAFHCESNTFESGRRLVEHEFPKRNLPYLEDLGHRAISWDVRGYVIVYPYDVKDSVLYQRDYRNARDALMRELDKGGPAKLQMQTLPPLTVYCERYRVTETEKYGGYCVFDMSFKEMGTEPYVVADTRTNTLLAATSLRDQILQQLANA